MNETHENYWAEYTGLQEAKHQLLRKYLAGWFPILTSFHGRVIYVDCHAGRGSHKTGQKGSPILALQELLTHRFCARILRSTEVQFIFFENDLTNYKHLCTEIQSLGELPSNIKVEIVQEDYEKSLRERVNDMNRYNKLAAPSFAFVDPFGFTLSMELLNDLLALPRCELFINFMSRFVDMAIRQPVQAGNLDSVQASNLDSLFGCPDWRNLASIEDYQERTYETMALFSHQLKAKFVTHMNMIGTNKVLKYVLLHATNHPRGRELIKESMWAVVPDGTFTAFERDNPDQLVLVEPELNLKPLKDLLWENFAGRQIRMKQIYDWLLQEWYLRKHVHQVLKEYKDQGFVNFSDYGKRFGFKNNPLVSFPPTRPADS